MSGVLTFFFLTPLALCFWRQEIVNLASDCVAEGIRKSRRD